MRRFLWIGALLLTGCPSSHGMDEDAGGVVYDECSAPSDCVVVPASCCGSCGAATRGDAIAVATDRASAYRTSACGADTGCPACFMEPDPTLVATCTAGRCAVVDLAMHAATECTVSADCRVRAAECCECGATITESTVVAVSDGAAYEALVCDPGMGCPECEPLYPDTIGATCEGGRCAIILAGRP
ncbi:MAG: hypothetical protein R3B82_17685 [Sandaracinaceae bacterium]